VPRSPLFVLAIATVALLALIPAGKAAAEWPDKGTIVFLELELKTNNGFSAQLEATPDGMVTLEFRDKGQFVFYEVQGEVTETGLKVRFGRLGLIDVVFAPTTTLNSADPPPGCTGAPRTLKEGVFTGTINFIGEREFVRVEGPGATGSMSVLPEWQCLDEPTPSGAPFSRYGSISRTAGASRLPARDSEAESEHASLRADSRGCACFFTAGIHHRDRKGRPGRSIFYGVKEEIRGGMEIARVTQGFAGPAAFVFNHRAGTATLRAPQPLSGRATFRERPGRDLWRSTIRVPLPGAAPLRTGGPGFSAELFPEYQFD
jgi:hypothetical protein